MINLCIDTPNGERQKVQKGLVAEHKVCWITISDFLLFTCNFFFFGNTTILMIYWDSTWCFERGIIKIVYWKKNLFSFLFCVVLYLILIQYLFLIKLYILSPFSWKYNFQQCGYRQRLRTTTKVNTILLVIFPCCIRRDLTEWQLLYLGKANQQLFSSGVPQFRSSLVLD